MNYTQIPEDTFKNIQLNAGVLLKSFEPTTGTVSPADIIGATSGGVNFDDSPTFTDYGEDIDNCPKNTKELKRIENREVKMTGTYITITAALVAGLMAAADVSGEKITPRDDLKDTDFSDLWWVGDYSDINTGTKAGYVAIHMMNTMATGGFKLQSSDKNKGTFAFEYTAHYSIKSQSIVPYEVYVHVGTAAA